MSVSTATNVTGVNSESPGSALRDFGRTDAKAWFQPKHTHKKPRNVWMSPDAGNKQGCKQCSGERDKPKAESSRKTKAKKYPESNLKALEDWKFEGSIITMPIRVASWMKGVKAAMSPDESDFCWKMEDDYQVEEYAPLEEWTRGCETWAMSNPPSEGDQRDPATYPDEEFVQSMIQLKQPNGRVRALWMEFVQVRLRPD